MQPRRTTVFNDWLIFILGVAGAGAIKAIGSFPICEAMVLFLLPILLFVYPDRAFRREYRWFYILLVAWLVGTVFSDAFRSMPVVNRAKGISRVLFFGLDFATLAILIDRKRRGMAIFSATIAIVMFINMFHFKTFVTQWKFGGSSCLTIVSLLVASYFHDRRRYGATLVIFLALAALNLIFAFRSQFGMDLVAAALTSPFLMGRSSDPSRSHIGFLRVLAVLMAMVAVGYAANKVVILAAQNGFFNASIQEKFETQASGRFGTLIGGRPETLVAIRAILDSPIIGHGSYAIDERYALMEEDLAYEYGYLEGDYAGEGPEDDTIPAHSHLTEAWIDSGILGGVFWIYILVIVVWALFKLIVLRPSMMPLYCYFLVNFIWDILYSPMGDLNRIWGAFFIMMSYDLLWRAHQKRAGSRELLSKTRLKLPRAAYRGLPV